MGGDFDVSIGEVPLMRPYAHHFRQGDRIPSFQVAPAQVRDGGAAKWLAGAKEAAARGVNHMADVTPAWGIGGSLLRPQECPPNG